jgi:hypothetical protein
MTTHRTSDGRANEQLRSFALLIAIVLAASTIFAACSSNNPTRTPTPTAFAGTPGAPSVAQFAPAPTTPSSGATMFISAAAAQPLVSGEFTVTVAVRNVANLGAFSFTLTIDSDAVAIDTITEGDFLRSSGRETTCGPPDIQPQSLRFQCVSLRPAPPSGTGTIASVRLRALKQGTVNLGLVDVQLAEADETATAFAATSVGAKVEIR